MHAFCKVVLGSEERTKMGGQQQVGLQVRAPDASCCPALLRVQEPFYSVSPVHSSKDFNSFRCWVPRSIAHSRFSLIMYVRTSPPPNQTLTSSRPPFLPPCRPCLRATSARRSCSAPP